MLNAIEQSCNPYFWNAFRSTLEKDGYGPDNERFRKNYDEWADRIKSFGLGEKFKDGDIYMDVTLMKRDGTAIKSRIKELHTFTGLGRTRNTEVSSGDICALVGIDGFEIGDTVADAQNPEALEPIAIDEPTMNHPQELTIRCNFYLARFYFMATKIIDPSLGLMPWKKWNPIFGHFYAIDIGCLHIKIHQVVNNQKIGML